MNISNVIVILATGVALSLGTVSDARAQHEGHQMPNATASAPRNAACASGGQKALALVEAASQRIETARAANGAVEMHAAVSEMRRAVTAAQAQLFACRAAVLTAPVGATPPDAMTGMDHSKMNHK